MGIRSRNCNLGSPTAQGAAGLNPNVIGAWRQNRWGDVSDAKPAIPVGDQLPVSCHRLSQNWRGKPLVSHEVAVNLIGATTTRTGLRVQSQLDTNRYPAGRTVSDDELEAIYLRRDSFHGEWNYSLLPRVALLN